MVAVRSHSTPGFKPNNGVRSLIEKIFVGFYQGHVSRDVKAAGVHIKVQMNGRLHTAHIVGDQTDALAFLYLLASRHCKLVVIEVKISVTYAAATLKIDRIASYMRDGAIFYRDHPMNAVRAIPWPDVLALVPFAGRA